MSKFTICGPVQDGQFTVWIVRGPKGGQIAEFGSRKAAREFVRLRQKGREHKELVNAR